MSEQSNPAKPEDGMEIAKRLRSVRWILAPEPGQEVEKTVADLLLPHAAPDCRWSRTAALNLEPRPGKFIVAADNGDLHTRVSRASLPAGGPWAAITLRDDGSGFILSNRAHLLPACYHMLLSQRTKVSGSSLSQPKVITPVFPQVRPVFDYFLTQTWRTAAGFNAETYVARYAGLGYSHLEVNGLAAPYPFEQGCPDEVYPRFYSYCPALDQFVSSRLNWGIYPADYLATNLAVLRRNARLARKYGLRPGLLVFEPRSVPESLFERYPMLRGARVDHPFRSLRPRYNLTLAHPAVREHYAEMMHNLLTEVPELDYVAIWSNDSGAGFEHTHSLYVGRNGGAYLIREWKTHDEIAKAAAANIGRFLRVLRDAAREHNPDFRVVLRIDPFDNEREYLWPEFREGVDVEGPSILGPERRQQYRHPKVPECTEVLGSLHHIKLFAEEKSEKEALERKGSEAHFVTTFGLGFQFEPLIGIPCPWLVAEKLRSLAKTQVRWLAVQGGTAPPELVPWWINNEVFCAYQFDPELDVDALVQEVARKWVGEELAPALVESWRLADAAVRAYPNPNFLFSTFGAVWYRILVRPLVPNSAAIPEEERAYYEKHTCNPPHNPQRVDLARDVLFQLTTQDRCERALAVFDVECLPRVNQAIELLALALRRAKGDSEPAKVLRDQHDRLRALRCWLRNTRNCAAWVAGVHGYLRAKDVGSKDRYRQVVREMVEDEIQNTRDLLELWERSSVAWMPISGLGENMFMYDENFGEHLRKKMALMELHAEDEPFIDSDFMWKKSAPSWTYAADREGDETPSAPGQDRE